MATTQDTVPEITLNDTERAVLTEIAENGRATTTFLANELGVSRTYVGDRVRRLKEHNYLEEIAPRLYDVTEKGRVETND